MFSSQAVAQRQDGRVVLYLSKKHLSPPIPFELLGHISSDDWAIRVPALSNLAARYYMPVFERLWLFFAVVIALILPLASYHPILILIYKTSGTQTTKNIIAGIISLVISIATLLLFWTPVFVWKKIGNHRVCALLASYYKLDEARSSICKFIPKWSVSIPGVSSTNIILTITTPPTAPITSFHPDAYLPAYISKAEEAQSAYFYPYPAASHEAGLPRMSVIGGYGAQEKV